MADQEATYTQQGGGSRGTAATQEPPAVPVSSNGHGQGASPADGGPAAPPNPRRRRIIGVVAAVAIVIGLFWGLRYWNYSRTHVSTDDAYVTGNLVNVSPIISGTLAKLTLEEGDQVKAGQLIAQLDQSGPKASLEQARAAYLAALSQVPQAQLNLTYQNAATQAAIARAQASLAEQNAKTMGAQQQALVTAATVTGQTQQARQQEAAAEAQAAQADAQIATAQANLAAARQAIETAQHSADAYAADVTSARAAAQNAQWNLQRYQDLRQRDAVTQQQLNAQQAQADTAAAQLAAAQSQAAQAQSQVAQARAAAAQAAGQLAAAKKAAAASHRQVNVAAAQVRVALANQGQVGVQQSNVRSSVGQQSAAQADLAAAQAQREQVALRRSMVRTSVAEAAQAKAAYDNAMVNYKDTYITAPSDGQIVRKAANVGAALSQGQTIVTMTAGNEVWVTANYKETQLAHVRIGQPAEVEVDALPGKTFLGEVQSINAATGASTALLPPDNATGNFTKVVQRVPVKIALRPARSGEDPTKYATAQDIAMLRQGMSVTATIDTARR